MALIDDDKKYVLNLYNRLPLEIIDAEGMYLTDVDGRKFLDFYSGIAVNILGHQHPKVMEAVKKQVDSYLHLSNYFVAPSTVELAKSLVENSFANKVFFANSGTEANEAMIKVAKKYGREKDPDKVNFVSLESGFHGRTIGGLSLTGNEKYKAQFAPVMPGVKHVPLNDLSALENAVDEHTCGIMFEVVQGEAGIRLVTEEFINKVKTLAQKYDVLILIDEVQTGLFRTGKLFAYEYFDIVPDIVTLAKGLGGGLPIGAMLVSERLEEVLSPGDHGTTFGGNPVAAAAGKALLDIILENDFQEHIHHMSQLLFKELIKLQQKYPTIILEVRGLGLMIGVDVGIHAAKIKDAAFKKGVLLNVTGKSVIRLLPAFVVEEKDIQLFLDTFEEVMEELGN